MIRMASTSQLLQASSLLSHSPYCCAPMVQQSELPFRMLVRKYDCNVAWTPMINANTFRRLSPTSKQRVFTSCAEDRPLVAQIAGHDVLAMMETAKWLEHHCDAIDINLGCPQAIAKRGCYGAFLMERTELVKEIVETLSKSLSIPLTCKIRIFPHPEQTIRFAHMLQNAGCALLTVHGRTKEQNKMLTGPVDLDIIRRIKSELSIPVIANGGVSSLDEAKRILYYTGCDGVMSSEALLANPALFSGKHIDPLSIAREYLDLVNRYPGADLSSIRAHLFKILHPLLQRYVSYRDQLATADNFIAFVDSLEHEIELERAVNSDAVSQYFELADSWYWRYRSFKIDASYATACENMRKQHEKQRQKYQHEMLIMADGP